MLLFTVFTPTYNRVQTLHRVYESLIAQTFKEFEWLIVDDGSTDGTEALVRNWQQDVSTWFPIRYIWQQNQHKKVAHNRAVHEAGGELFLTLDSDDRCVPRALERLAYHWHAIPALERPRFSAVTVLCADEGGNIVGDRFPDQQWLDSDPLQMRYRHKVKGEKWGFQRTVVLKDFLFPEHIEGLIPEGVVWSKVAKQYRTRFVNEPLRVYCQDYVGSVGQLSRDLDPRSNAPGHLYWKRIILTDEIGFFLFQPKDFVFDAARLTRFYLHCRPSARDRYWPNSRFGRLLTAVMAPVGGLWWLVDMIRLQR